MNRPSRRITLLVLLPLTLLCGSTLLAQEVTGSLEGRALDEDDMPIAGAIIVVSGPSLQGTRTATSDSRGFFRLPLLPPGTYAAKIEHPAYQELTLENVQIRLGQTTGLERVRLKARAVMEEKIVVTAEQPRIDPRSTTSGGTIASEYFTNVPTDRNYRSIAELLPHVSASYLGDETNYAGGTGLDNRYFIDGMDVTDPLRGATGTNLPFNFIKEVDVKLGGYQAEYRSALGAAVNVITHSGSNEFHSNLWGYFVNDTLSGELRQSTVELQTESYSKYDVGFDVSGPLIRDRLWYYLAYNPTFANADVEIPGQGFFPDEATMHSFAGKLSWQIDARNNLVATIIGDPMTREGVGDTLIMVGTPVTFENPDPYLRDIETGGYNLALQGRHILGEKLILESFFSGVTRREKNGAATERGREEPLFVDFETGTWSDGSPTDLDYKNTQLTLGVKAIWALGTHEFRAGVEFRDGKLDSDLYVAVIARQNDQLFFSQVMDVQGIIRSRVPTLFVQDSWRVAPKWRFNYGLRWDGQYLIGSDGKVAQRITDQYQPRLGFTYLPGRPGSQRVYGSVGRYYHDLAATAPSFLYQENSGWTRCLYDHDPRLDPTGCEILVEPRAEIYPEVDGLRGQHYDEFSMGYERAVGSEYTAGARLVYRTLREGLENGISAETGLVEWGNPGRGLLSEYPTAKRDYRALELTFARQPAGRFSFLTSYVLSSNEGNYPGLFNSDYDIPWPNYNASFDRPEMLIDADGVLPNDRTHVFKFSGFYRFDFGLMASTFLVWQSGTPLNEFGGTTWGNPFFGFIQPRGTAGRTPSIFDLNLRLGYDLALGANSKSHARFLLDVFHLFSDRDPVDFDQVHYFNLDDEGNQTDPNPTYGMPTRYQPPTAVRLGMQFSF